MTIASGWAELEASMGKHMNALDKGLARVMFYHGAAHVLGEAMLSERRDNTLLMLLGEIKVFAEQRKALSDAEARR